jgi:hypothetical protein
VGPGLRRAVFATATLAVIVACRQLVGIGDSPPMGAVVDSGTKEAGTDAGGCGIVYAGTQCEACLESQCCTQATACANGAACSGLEGCLGACDGGDPACRAQCVDGHRIGSDALETQLAACLAKRCAQPCSISCGGFAGDFGVDAAAGCQTCIVDNPNLCSATLACAGDPECQAILTCPSTSHVQDQSEACDTEHEAGVDAASAVLNGLTTACLNACAVGTQWWCVGNPPSQQQVNQATAVTLHLYDKATTLPIADASVAVCSPSLSPCLVLGNPMTSGADGGVTVNVPKNPQGPGSSGYLSITGTGLTPELFF